MYFIFQLRAGENSGNSMWRENYHYKNTTLFNKTSLDGRQAQYKL